VDIREKVINSYLPKFNSGFLKDCEKTTTMSNLINIFEYIIKNNNINQFLKACNAGYFKILEKCIDLSQKRKVYNFKN
jgi:hypothetical protein